MPFGLSKEPATFQRIMDQVLENELWKFAIPYSDDMIIFSESVEDHKKHLKIVLGKLRSTSLSFKRKKCHFWKEEMKILNI